MFALLAQRVSATTSVDTLIARMSAEEKLGQLLIAGFAGTTVSPQARILVQELHVGGIVLYAQNLQEPAQIRALNRALQRHASYPLLIAIDQEGGVVRRLTTGVPQLPGNMALGATRTERFAEEAAYELGLRLHALGFTMNLAPVLDVYTTAESSIATRSFGADPHTVAAYGRAFIRGHAAAGMIAVAKHFPGEGGIPGDTHHDLLRSIATREELAGHLIPFRAAIQEGVPALLVSHATYAAIADTPAITAPEILTTMLREELGFDGVIITDALQMARDEDYGRTAVEALIAGADLILTPGVQTPDISRALLAAYRSGTLTEERVRSSLRRILTLKLRPLRAQRRPRRPLIDRTIAEHAITMVPPRTVRGRVAYVGPPGALYDHWRANATLLPAPTPDDPRQLIASAVTAAQSADLLVASCANRRQAAVLRAVAAQVRVPIIAVSLGNPHDLAGLTSVANVYAYSSLPAAQQAVLDVLTAKRKPTGQLPIPIPISQAVRGQAQPRRLDAQK